MPTEYAVDEALGILRIRRWGSMSTEDEDRASDDRSHDLLVKQGLPVLLDCRGVEPADTGVLVRYLADSANRLSAHLKCGPIAIVVDSTVEYGMARMYMALTDLTHPDTQVFRDIHEAESWLASTRGA
jgi:hypothetical protein